jgi:L-2-hydroxyglutarate oxidase LhgO
LKGQLCLEGNELMYRICQEHGIPHRNTKKLIVAVDDREEAALPELLTTARDNGARGVEIISRAEIARIEPNVRAQAALYCPTSGIVDTHRLMQHWKAVAVAADAQVVFNTEVVSIQRVPGGYAIGTRGKDGSRYDLKTRILINCAGLCSGHIAALAGIDIDQAGYRIQHKKGVYYRAHARLALFPRALIYPVPPVPGSVGIHTTPDLGGGMRLGPHDFWVDGIDYSVPDEYRDLFMEAAKPFLPFLTPEILAPDYAGIHPKLQKPGEPVRDFVIQHEADRDLAGLINLVGIESPGVTSSPAIGRHVARMVDEIDAV